MCVVDDDGVIPALASQSYVGRLYTICTWYEQGMVRAFQSSHLEQSHNCVEERNGLENRSR